MTLRVAREILGRRMPDSYDGEREHLTRLFLTIPVVQNQEGRQAVLDEMRRRQCELNVRITSTVRVDSVQIIDAALARQQGLHRLARAVYLLDDSDPSLEFAHHINQKHVNQFLSLLERRQMIRELGLYVRPQDLKTYYRLATGELTQREFENLYDLVDEIEQFAHRGRGNPLIRLTEAIADRLPADDEASAARRWSDLMARRIDQLTSDRAEQEILAGLRSARAHFSAAALGRPTLMLQLDPDIVRSERYRFTAKLFLGKTFIDKVYQSGDGNPLSLACVQQTLRHVLHKAHVMADEAEDDAAPMNLEFFLPRALLCLPIEKWADREQSYMSLALRFVVVVRDLDRQSDPELRRTIRRKWEQMEQKNGEEDSGLDHWVTCVQQRGDLLYIYRDVVADDCVSLGLTFQPGDGSHTFELSEVLNAGIPIAVWPHQCEHAGSRSPGRTYPNFKAELSRRLTGRSISDLPRIVQELRREYVDDPGLGVTLLWDDPTRRAGPDDHRLDAPESGGQTR